MKQELRLHDPRLYQIAVLSLLVLFGVLALDLGIQWYNALAIVFAASATQFIAGRAVGHSTFDPRSVMITALSLTLLLRTDSIVLAATAAACAIGSKFLIRVDGKHVFNPANFAIGMVLLLSDSAWVSSGQWGSGVVGALALACLGGMVLTKARRAETTIGFLVVYAALLFGRAIWLQDPLGIAVHALQNGALLIFAFFMISDPRTTPDSAFGRLLFAAIVAVTAFTIQFIYYQPNGPILALIIAAPLVPLIDLLSRGSRYQWQGSHKQADSMRDVRNEHIEGAT